jgi:hypothetical protein
VKALIFEHWSIDYHERGIDKFVDRLSFSHITARPQHRREDTEAWKRKKNFPAALARVRAPARCARRGLVPYVDGLLLARLLGRSLALICPACCCALHMNAGQDGSRDASSKQDGDLQQQVGHWNHRSTLVRDRSITTSPTTRQAPAPFHAIPRAWAGPSLLAMIMSRNLVTISR